MLRSFGNDDNDACFLPVENAPPACAHRITIKISLRVLFLEKKRGESIEVRRTHRPYRDRGENGPDLRCSRTTSRRYISIAFQLRGWSMGSCNMNRYTRTSLIGTRRWWLSRGRPRNHKPRRKHGDPIRHPRELKTKAWYGWRYTNVTSIPIIPFGLAIP